MENIKTFILVKPNNNLTQNPETNFLYDDNK